MRVLHISDLHIVADNTLNKTKEFQAKLSDIGVDFPVSVASKNGMEKLLKHFRDNENSKIDFIIFSGDATSLGDIDSLHEAATFLKSIAEIVLVDNSPERCLAISGNHDALEYGVRALYNQLDEELGVVGDLVLRLKSSRVADFKKHLGTFLDTLEVVGPSTHGDFRASIQSRFKSAFDAYALTPSGDEAVFKECDGTCINGEMLKLSICPLNTMPIKPIFANMAVVTEDHLRSLVASQKLQSNIASDFPTVNLAVSHHGLMAMGHDIAVTNTSERINMVAVLEHSITSQINGYRLGKALQTAGFDAHIHGHEHYNSIMRYDFNVENQGSIYSIGVGAAYEMDAKVPEFCVMEFPNPHCATLDKFRYEPEKSQFDFERSNVIFDKEYTTDNSRLVKREIRRFFFDETVFDPSASVSAESFNRECDKLLFNSDKRIFIFGVKLSDFRNNIIKSLRNSRSEQKEKIVRKVKDFGIDILVVKPINKYLSWRTYDAKTLTSDLQILTEEWQSFFKTMAELTGYNVNELSRNWRLRHTTTPIGYAGVCELEEQDDGTPPIFRKALIQTIKVVEEFDDPFYVELNYKTNNGLMQYYAGSAWNLWFTAISDDSHSGGSIEITSEAAE